jgi:hypothetical protein
MNKHFIGWAEINRLRKLEELESANDDLTLNDILTKTLYSIFITAGILIAAFGVMMIATLK